MQRFLVGGLILLAATLPAAATMRHHRHHRGYAHDGGPGMPITAERDSIRINSVGQVISQPVPVIEKERNFENRAQHELSKPQPALGATPQPVPGATPTQP
jgi:hypothetical protein